MLSVKNVQWNWWIAEIRGISLSSLHLTVIRSLVTHHYKYHWTLSSHIYSTTKLDRTNTVNMKLKIIVYILVVSIYFIFKYDWRWRVDQTASSDCISDSKTWMKSEKLNVKIKILPVNLLLTQKQKRNKWRYLTQSVDRFSFTVIKDKMITTL